MTDIIRAKVNNKIKNSADAAENESKRRELCKRDEVLQIDSGNKN
jgi:hypothetical protein